MLRMLENQGFLALFKVKNCRVSIRVIIDNMQKVTRIEHGYS